MRAPIAPIAPLHTMLLNIVTFAAETNGAFAAALTVAGGNMKHSPREESNLGPRYDTELDDCGGMSTAD